MENLHTTPPVLHPLNFKRCTTTGPENNSEALVLAMALVLTAPTPELREIAEVAMAQACRLQFPASYQRFHDTGIGGFTEEETEIWEWFGLVATVWAEGMKEGKVPLMSFLIVPDDPLKS